jgi:hypothetical protein
LVIQKRGDFKRAMIVTEGLFSMDGNIPDLPRLIELKKQYDCLLMVDEAHSLGVLGATGRGIREYYNVSSMRTENPPRFSSLHILAHVTDKKNLLSAQGRRSLQAGASEPLSIFPRAGQFHVEAAREGKCRAKSG